MVDAESKRRIGVYGHSGRPRRGRLIEKDQKLNIDAQDAQDNQAGTLLHEKLTGAKIRYAFADTQECKPAVS